jgi:hypothetical protein
MVKTTYNISSVELLTVFIFQYCLIEHVALFKTPVVEEREGEHDCSKCMAINAHTKKVKACNVKM